MSQQAFIVGLTGGSASGKTTFVRKLQQSYSDNHLAVISIDNYYKPLSKQIKDESGEVNFDRPEAIDFNRLIKDVRKLGRGQSIEIVEYTFNDLSKFPKVINVQAAPIILIEGLFIFNDVKLRRMFDWTLFLDTPAELAKLRRIKRDTAERGMTEELILHQWINHVIPAFEDHLQPFKTMADVIITSDSDYIQSFEHDLVSTKFDSLLTPF